MKNKQELAIELEEYKVTAAKVVLVGPAIGKTSLLRCLTGKNYRSDLLPTMGVDFATKEFEGCRLRIWDTSATISLKLLRLYLQEADSLVLVWDGADSNKTTIKELVDDVNEQPGMKNIPKILARIRIEDSQIQCTLQKENAFKQEIGACFCFRCSAKTGIGVQDGFTKMVKYIDEYRKVKKSNHINNLFVAEIRNIIRRYKNKINFFGASKKAAQIEAALERALKYFTKNKSIDLNSFLDYRQDHLLTIREALVLPRIFKIKKSRLSDQIEDLVEGLTRYYYLNNFLNTKCNGRNTTSGCTSINMPK